MGDERNLRKKAGQPVTFQATDLLSLILWHMYPGGGLFDTPCTRRWFGVLNVTRRKPVHACEMSCSGILIPPRRV
jgi:hypothetical protein